MALHLFHTLTRLIAVCAFLNMIGHRQSVSQPDSPCALCTNSPSVFGAQLLLNTQMSALKQITFFHLPALVYVTDALTDAGPCVTDAEEVENHRSLKAIFGVGIMFSFFNTVTWHMLSNSITCT